jgi:hypothetical protein
MGILPMSITGVSPVVPLLLIPFPLLPLQKEQTQKNKKKKHMGETPMPRRFSVIDA